MELVTNKGFSFSRNEFIKICPFFFSFDENLIVKDSGNAVFKVFGNVKDVKLFDIVALEIDEKSPIQSFEYLKKLVHTTIFFKPAKFNDKSRFKGQLVNADNSDLLLIFSPIIEQIEDLEKLNLIENDFAPQDIISEFYTNLKKNNSNH